MNERALAAATLASLPRITPARLRRALASAADPVAALQTIDRPDLDAIQQRLRARRPHVWIAGDSDFPIRDAVPGRPAVLLGEGSRPDAFDRPRVAIVGTRAATPHGLADARELAMVLASEGITVVSGLAIGIDGAAHEGAIEAGGLTVGVVATGLDVVYPRRHAALFERVRMHGMLVSEHGYGVQPHPSRFPERNRIIAALADAVVIVEATRFGGALITARYANDYSREVLAVPGSRRNPAAVGCNRLIQDGAHVCNEPGDVLIALQRPPGGAEWAPRPGAEDTDDVVVLHALGGEAASTDELVERTGFAAGRVAGTLRQLELRKVVSRRRGRWWPV